MPIGGWAEFREPKGEGQPGLQRFERGGARWGAREGAFLEETIGPRGPDGGGGAQLSLGRGWQSPHSRGSLERGHRRANRAQLRSPSGWQLGADFVPSRPHSTPSLHLLSSFICSFDTCSPCATFGPKPGRQELSVSACSLGSKTHLDGRVDSSAHLHGTLPAGAAPLGGNSH